MLENEDDDDTARLSDLIALAEDDEDTFFSQAIEAIDEAEAAYYKRKADRANAGEPSHMSEAEEDVLFSQATDEVEAAYYSRRPNQGITGEPSHNNEVVVKDWYSDDKLLTQYVSD
jgi:hypothetical protein